MFEIQMIESEKVNPEMFQEHIEAKRNFLTAMQTYRCYRTMKIFRIFHTSLSTTSTRMIRPSTHRLGSGENDSLMMKKTRQE